MNTATGLQRADDETPAASASEAQLAWPGVVVERIASLADRFRWGRAALAPSLALILALSAVLSARVRHGGLDIGVALALAVSSTVPLLLIRWWPALALTLVIAADGVYVTAARLSWPAAAVVGWLIAIAACPVVLRRTFAVVLLAITESYVAAAVFVPASLNATPWDASITEGLAALLLWGVGERFRVRRAAAKYNSAVSAQLRGLRDSEAIARSRAGIARELHDVVAHHVSLIAVLAATAPYQLPELSDDAAKTFDEIAEEARSAMSELRTILGVLRSPDGDAPESPQPTLADLPSLVDRVRVGGTTVTCEVIGTPRHLSDAIDLCCYRVVQESLTNVARHAPGARARVELCYGADHVAVSIQDTGGDGRSPVVGAPGYGIVGMRERVLALGGTFVAGPVGRGFEVVASLPARVLGLGARP